jgi:hypothetical protein
VSRRRWNVPPPEIDRLADALARLLASYWRGKQESRSSDSLAAGRTTATDGGDLDGRSLAKHTTPRPAAPGTAA